MRWNKCQGDWGGALYTMDDGEEEDTGRCWCAGGLQYGSG